MPYVIKKTDGNIVATITDGTVDKSSTSITLIGKNYKGIGEIYNSNLVYLLENFANTTPPSNQLKGQLWFNSSTSKLNVYDGSSWRPVGSPFVSGSRPNNLVQGDLWIDSANQQLKFYDGSNLVTAGPIYTANQGKAGWIVEEILDTRGNTKIVASMYVSNIRMAILNTETFIPLVSVPGFTTGTSSLYAGLTLNSAVTDNNINAPAQATQTFIDPVDGPLDTTKFVRSDKSSSIDGQLTLTSPDGLIIAVSNSGMAMYVDQTGGTGNYKTYLTNNGINDIFHLQVRDAVNFQDAIVANPVTKTLSFYPTDTWAISGTTPEIYMNGNATIQGTLTVVGETQFTNSTTLQITDKNIELAVVPSPTNTSADGAGITVLGGSNNNKTLKWSLVGATVSLNPTVTVPAWEVNDNFKIPSTNSYYIGNNNMLNTTTLGSTVVNSSLTSVGGLVDLTAADFSFTDNIVTLGANLDLVIAVDSGQVVTMANRVRITNVDYPNTSEQFDVANVQYVKDVKSSITYLTVDITGLVTPNTQAVGQIEALIPATTVNVGDIARVLCLSYTNTTSPQTAPLVTRVVKRFTCELVDGLKTWVYVTGSDLPIA